MKRQNFENFQDSTKRHRLSSQSPVRANQNLSSKMGSPKGGSQRTQPVDYTSLTDAKIAIIVQGSDVLKRRKSSKICNLFGIKLII